MDGSVSNRIEKLLAKLAARTDHQGKPKAGYEQNVPAIRAELEALEEKKGTSKNVKG